MSFIVGEVPYFDAFLRREYTRNLTDGHGDFYPVKVYGLRCIRGASLWFQSVLSETYAGANFMAPIEAFTWKRNSSDVDMTYIQPWDTFSETFGVHEFTFLRRMTCVVLPDKKPARYRFTIDFAGNDLSEDPEQHKHLHVVFLDDGRIGAFPNNRLLFSDPAYWSMTADKPDFISLAGEFRAE